MPAALLALALAAQPPDFDAFAWRARIGQAAFDGELVRLQESYRRPGAPARGQIAVRLAPMLVAREAPSRSAYRRDLAAARTLHRRLQAELRQAVRGDGDRTEWLNSRWLNSAFRTRDPDARGLFRRVFADQFNSGIDVPERLRPAVTAWHGVDRDAVYRSNTAWLKGVLSRIGWFDISRYGAEASQAAWLIVQHSDHDPAWQERVLAALAPRVARGDMQRNYYAYLVDRVAVAAGRPQTYGTQGRCQGRGNLQLFEVMDRDSLDRRRAEMGLDTIADYTVRFCGRRE